MRIILDNEEDVVPRPDFESVVGDRFARQVLHDSVVHRDLVYERARCGVMGAAERIRRPDIFAREIERERAASAGHAAQLDFSAEKLR